MKLLNKIGREFSGYNILESGKRLVDRKPLQCSLYVTDRCNLDCAYCTEYDNSRPHPRLDDLKKWVRKIRELGTMRIRELAGITTPEPRMLLIQPWDATTVHPIEKAIQKSNLGLNPAVDKKFIRIVLPELSQERRLEFTKVVKTMAEAGRVAVRHVRRDAIEHLKKETKEGLITEDELKHAEKEVQKLTDQYIGKIDEHLAHKEKEIMTV